MPKGDKSSYSSKQRRKAEHIEEGYESRGMQPARAERIAWATVNKQDGGAKAKGASGKSRKTASRGSTAKRGTRPKASGTKSGASRKRASRKSTSSKGRRSTAAARR
jgi:hypothetical protein